MWESRAVIIICVLQMRKQKETWWCQPWKPSWFPARFIVFAGDVPLVSVQVHALGLTVHLSGAHPSGMRLGLSAASVPTGGYPVCHFEPLNGLSRKKYKVPGLLHGNGGQVKNQNETSMKCWKIQHTFLEHAHHPHHLPAATPECQSGANSVNLLRLYQQGQRKSVP